jgi:hypothetical protein
MEINLTATLVVSLTVLAIVPPTAKQLHQVIVDWIGVCRQQLVTREHWLETEMEDWAQSTFCRVVETLRVDAEPALQRLFEQIERLDKALVAQERLEGEWKPRRQPLRAG